MTCFFYPFPSPTYSLPALLQALDILLTKFLTLKLAWSRCLACNQRTLQIHRSYSSHQHQTHNLINIWLNQVPVRFNGFSLLSEVYLIIDLHFGFCPSTYLHTVKSISELKTVYLNENFPVAQRCCLSSHLCLLSAGALLVGLQEIQGKWKETARLIDVWLPGPTIL